MKTSLKKICLFFFCFLVLVAFLAPDILALTQEECIEKIERGENLDLESWSECEERLEEAKEQTVAQKVSLQSEIQKFNTALAFTSSQILKTTAEIKELEREIGQLSTKIEHLDLSLNQLSEILIRRVVATYKKAEIDPLILFFSSQNFSEFVNRYKYLCSAQLNDKKLIIQMETTRLDYKGQKDVKEDRQVDLESAQEKLESQKSLLSQQKADKERLLTATRNNEERYQEFLKITRAEIEAIQRIVAGEGDCSEVREVSVGERIASVISGKSACSLGTHLHFEIREDSAVKNPFSYLKSGVSYKNCSGSSCDSGDGDPFTPTGSWDWPLNEPIRFTQGFGETSAIRSHIVWYPFHTGIDLVSEDRTVKAVKSGKLSQCYISCGGGTLSYVKVDHQDSNLDTYYLHVSY